MNAHVVAAVDVSIKDSREVIIGNGFMILIVTVMIAAGLFLVRKLSKKKKTD